MLSTYSTHPYPANSATVSTDLLTLLNLLTPLGFQVEDAIEDLPWCLQSDIKSHMHAGVISDIPFFRKASPGFLRAIISKLKPIYVMVHTHFTQSRQLLAFLP
jgi:hypothetical protein